MRALVLVVLVVLAACSGSSNVVRKTNGEFEIHGRILRRIAKCGHQNTPTPFGGGEIVISSGGKTVARPKANQYGKYVVTLPPGEYCVREPSAQDCYAHWNLPPDKMPTKTPENELVVNDYDNRDCF